MMRAVRLPKTERRSAGLAIALCGALAASACSASTTAPCATPPTTLAGVWRYDATQDAPTRATLSGTMTLSAQTCNGLSGSLDVAEVTGLGSNRRLAGPVAGMVLTGSAIRLDAALDAVTRQHLGSLAADSIYGSWVESSAANGTASGSFRMRRGTGS